MAKIIYAATPLRMEKQIEKICDFIEKQGNFPLHPLLALPYKRYNYDRHSREDIYKVCFWLIDLCDELWIFGIGGGSLKEFQYAKQKGKKVRCFIKTFDKKWKEWSQKEKYQTRDKDILDEVLELSETH